MSDLAGLFVIAAEVMVTMVVMMRRRIVMDYGLIVLASLSHLHANGICEVLREKAKEMI